MCKVLNTMMIQAPSLLQRVRLQKMLGCNEISFHPKLPTAMFKSSVCTFLIVLNGTQSMHINQNLFLYLKQLMCQIPVTGQNATLALQMKNFFHRYQIGRNHQSVDENASSFCITICVVTQLFKWSSMQGRHFSLSTIFSRFSPSLLAYFQRVFQLIFRFLLNCNFTMYITQKPSLLAALRDRHNL